VVQSPGQALDSASIIAAINAQTEVLLQQFADSPTCAGATTIPKVYTGHKGDALNLAVYRGNALMSDAELVGATGLIINFTNTTTGQNFTIASGISASGGLVTYTTTAGDLVFEVAGKWEYQAEGVAATGESFRSQVGRTEVLAELQ